MTDRILDGRTVLIAPADYRRYAPEACALLESAGATLWENPHARPLGPDELLELAPTIDAAVVGVEVWTPELLAAAPRLRTLTKLGVGVDNIDLVAAAAHGVTVTNAPGGNANAVAEFTVAGILAFLRGLTEMESALRAGQWPRVVGNELTGRSLGLIGFGQIGRLLARRMSGFDLEVRAYDPFPSVEVAAELGVTLGTRDEVLAASDLVSIHLPVTAETERSVDAAFFAAMKPGAIFINSARGALVDEDALLAALDSGHLGGAVLDVFQQEPVDPQSALVRHPRVLATPHGAADTVESYRRIGLVNASSILDVARGDIPPTRVAAP
jgi:D-3-phosphoglycerate dehydrogenase / 2-oxoglutarate reductase